MSEEERVVILRNGEEGKLFVSRVGNGRFRIEDFFGFCLLSEEFPGDVPEDAGFGWVIEVDELEDGRLQALRVVPDPNIECVSGVLIPPGFPYSLEFERFSAVLIATGGKWEVVARGLFSAYVPKRKPEGNRFSFERDFNDALNDWIRRQDKACVSS